MEVLQEKMKNIKPLNIEAHVSSLFIDNETRTSTLEKISEQCKKQFDLQDLNIYILKSNKNDIPVFMGVLTMKQKNSLKTFILKKFKTKRKEPVPFSKGLNIVIDHRLFLQMNQWGFTFSAKEIVAGIVHEIGHVYQIEKMISDIADKMIFADVHTPIQMNTYIADKIDDYMTNMDISDIEMSADALAIHYGYGQELMSLLKKFKSIYEKYGGSNVSKQQQLLVRKRYDNILSLLKEELSDDENDEYTKTYIRKQIAKIRYMGY